MYICVCAAIDETAVKQALQEGKCPVEDLGCCQNCGHCYESVVQLQDGSNKLEQ